MTGEYKPPAYTALTRPLLKFIVGGLFRLLGHTRVVGKENVPLGQPYIVAVNHVSIIDPPAVLVFWPETL
ncbi:MAG TPA: hypothetical protein VIV15_06790, partial [Anaerolineales bacterium]